MTSAQATALKDLRIAIAGDLHGAWGDADGDRIYTSFVGDTQKGVNTIIGGTGKYAGWTGSGPWACYDLGANGSNRCKQSINYTKP